MLMILFGREQGEGAEALCFGGVSPAVEGEEC